MWCLSTRYREFRFVCRFSVVSFVSSSPTFGLRPFSFPFETVVVPFWMFSTVAFASNVVFNITVTYVTHPANLRNKKTLNLCNENSYSNRTNQFPTLRSQRLSDTTVRTTAACVPLSFLAASRVWDKRIKDKKNRFAKFCVVVKELPGTDDEPIPISIYNR